MSNNEFIKRYGRANFESIVESLDIQLFYLKSTKQIRGYHIQKKKGLVNISYNKQQYQFHVADIYNDTWDDIFLKMKGKELMC